MFTALIQRLLAFLRRSKAPAADVTAPSPKNLSEAPSRPSQERAYNQAPDPLDPEARWRKATARALPSPARLDFDDDRVPFIVRHRRVNVFNLPDLLDSLMNHDERSLNSRLPHPLDALTVNPVVGPINVPASLAGIAAHSGLNATVLSITADHKRWFDYCVVYDTSSGQDNATIITSTGEIILGFRSASSISKMLGDDVRDKLGLSPTTQVFSYWYRWDTPMLTWEIVPTLTIRHG